jgi:hypothetical protein
VDDAVVCHNIGGDDVGRAAICVGEYPTILEEETALKRSEAIRAQDICGVATSIEYVIE